MPKITAKRNIIMEGDTTANSAITPAPHGTSGHTQHTQHSITLPSPHVISGITHLLNTNQAPKWTGASTHTQNRNTHIHPHKPTNKRKVVETVQAIRWLNLTANVARLLQDPKMLADLDSRGSGNLDTRTVTICSGMDFVNITYNNFVASDEKTAKVWCCVYKWTECIGHV